MLTSAVLSHLSIYHSNSAAIATRKEAKPKGAVDYPLLCDTPFHHDVDELNSESSQPIFQKVKNPHP